MIAFDSVTGAVDGFRRGVRPDAPACSSSTPATVARRHDRPVKFSTLIDVSRMNTMASAVRMNCAPMSR
jgi:hypothetical protein